MSDALANVETFLAQFVAYPSEHGRVAHTLWIAHTWLMECWESTPRIAFLSPEPGSGKTRALEVSELLVPRPVEAINVTPAYVFRKVADPTGPPTILYDEIDTVFGPKAKENEEIRGLLNAGHRQGAVAGRCVVRGKTVVTEEIPAYCAVAMAGLGGLPDTLLSRAVVIRMRKRAPGEVVQPFRRRVHVTEGHAIRNRLAAWAATQRDKLTTAWPVMPDGIDDRDADVWEPLIAIADVAGGTWTERARVAAVAHVADLRQGAQASLGVLLLRDLRTVFHIAEADRLSTTAVLDALHRMEESPWGDLRGKPLDARGLSRRLGEYGVGPKDLRIGDTVVKGYDIWDLADPWSRYLRSPVAGDIDLSSRRQTIINRSDHPTLLQESATSATSQVSGTEPVADHPLPYRDVDPSEIPVCGDCGWSLDRDEHTRICEE